MTVALPPGTDRSELYVAGADGYMLGLPEPQAGGGTATFSVPVYDKPEAKPAGTGLSYTLVAGDKAVSGVLPYP